ncbi:MAG: hypothetical protein U5K70_04415 [Halodesulfurarchaeum sp.]|nr:hypothetical protein [Halodesulfurarchaeum sp.]
MPTEDEIERQRAQYQGGSQGGSGPSDEETDDEGGKARDGSPSKGASKGLTEGPEGALSGAVGALVPSVDKTTLALGRSGRDLGPSRSLHGRRGERSSQDPDHTEMVTDEDIDQEANSPRMEPAWGMSTAEEDVDVEQPEPETVDEDVPEIEGDEMADLSAVADEIEEAAGAGAEEEDEESDGEEEQTTEELSQSTSRAGGVGWGEMYVRTLDTSSQRSSSAKAGIWRGPIPRRWLTILGSTRQSTSGLPSETWARWTPASRSYLAPLIIAGTVSVTRPTSSIEWPPTLPGVRSDA